jgi:hypothetical protein
MVIDHAAAAAILPATFRAAERDLKFRVREVTAGCRILAPPSLGEEPVRG